MTPKIKHIAIGLLIIAASALVATLRIEPAPPISTAPTADELYQEEIAEAIRTCGIYGKPKEERTTEIDGTVPLEECIEVNRECRARLGPHAVWSGTARSVFDEAGTEDLILNCKCDKGYEWLNPDGSIGVTSGTMVFNMIDGPGRCVSSDTR